MAHIRLDLETFDPQHSGRYDPGEIQIFYDNRTFGGFQDRMPFYQKYKLAALSRLGRVDVQNPDNLCPGYLRIIFYTHVGNQGTKDFPLHKWEAVKDMFDSLSEEGFRPMVIGYSNENPFPMLGGSEPPKPKEKPKPKPAKTWSNTAAGHSTAQGATPHDRIMAIIKDDEERAAKEREMEAMAWREQEKGGSVLQKWRDEKNDGEMERLV